jgi:hypothetical protein
MPAHWALHIALTATAHARAGHAEYAAQLALQALHQARNIRSRRVTARITQLAAALEPHHRVAKVAQFLDQSRSSDAIA